MTEAARGVDHVMDGVVCLNTTSKPKPRWFSARCAF